MMKSIETHILKTQIFTIIILIFALSCKNRQTSSFIGNNKNDNNYIPYYSEVYKADSLKVLGKKKEAFNKFDKLFKKYNPKNTAFIYELRSFLELSAELGQKIDNHFLVDYVKYWGNTNEGINNNDKLKYLYRKHNFTEGDIKQLQEYYNKNLNKEYIDFLKEVIKSDQKSRGTNKEQEIDSINFNKFINLYQKYGYPTIQLVDKKTKVALIPLFIHFNNDEHQYKKLLPILVNELQKGNLFPVEIQNFVALRDIEITRSYYFGNDGTSLFEKELQDTVPYDTIKKRRKQYALPTIEYQTWKNTTIK